MTINLFSNNHGLTKIHVVWAFPLVFYKTQGAASCPNVYPRGALTRMILLVRQPSNQEITHEQVFLMGVARFEFLGRLMKMHERISSRFERAGKKVS